MKPWLSEAGFSFFGSVVLGCLSACWTLNRQAGHVPVPWPAMSIRRWHVPSLWGGAAGTEMGINSFKPHARACREKGNVKFWTRDYFIFFSPLKQQLHPWKLPAWDLPVCFSPEFLCWRCCHQTLCDQLKFTAQLQSLLWEISVLHAQEGCGRGWAGVGLARWAQQGQRVPRAAAVPVLLLRALPPSRAVLHREEGQNLSAGFPSWLSEVVPVKPLNNIPNVSFHPMGKSIYGGVNSMYGEKEKQRGVTEQWTGQIIKKRQLFSRNKQCDW